MMFAGTMIAIEGPIGAGKSTTAKLVADRMKNFSDPSKINLVKEPVEECPYLEEFYEDPKAHSLKVQRWFLSKRRADMYDAFHRSWANKDISILDRTVFGDWCFAKANARVGNMTGDQMMAFKGEFLEALDGMPVPQYMFILALPVDLAMERIQERGREMEKDIPRNYIKELHGAYREFEFSPANTNGKYPYKKIVVVVKKEHTPKDVTDIIMMHLSRLECKKFPS